VHTVTCLVQERVRDEGKVFISQAITLFLEGVRRRVWRTPAVLRCERLVYLRNNVVAVVGVVKQRFLSYACNFRELAFCF